MTRYGIPRKGFQKMISNKNTCLLISALALCAATADETDAQIVRRFAGGGVAVRAPFVRVNVDPWGRTSVRAPFVAVDSPGAVGIGPHRRLARRQWRAERRALQAQQQAPLYSTDVQSQSAAPTPAEAAPIPSDGQLAQMELPELVSVLRDLSSSLQEALTRFEDPDGWQQYLAIPEEALPTPGTGETSSGLELLAKQLGRYDTVSTGGSFSKIAAMPSFAATHAALELLVERLGQPGPELSSPAQQQWQSDPGPASSAQPQEVLPTPPPVPEPATEEPEYRSGERSILKRG